ncbi:MAG: arsinothricin resistance N-acetyltransferase ArsN1 family B [Vulcanimicrobiaceae bacterium]
MGLQVRPANVADAGGCAAIYDPVVAGSTISFEEEPTGRDEMGRRIAAVMQHYPWLIAELDGALVGYAYASRHRERAAYRWAADVAVYVDERARRRGVGASLYAMLLAYLEEAGYRHAYAGVALPNDASIKLHEALGFETIGTYRRVGYKLGRWCDVTWLGRSLGAEPDAAPHEPIPFPQLSPPSLR